MAINYKSEFDRYKRYYLSLEPILAKPKNRAYTATVFSLLAISLFAWYGIRPTVQTILYLRREIADNQVINKQMEEKITKLIEAQSNYQNATAQLGLLYQALPENPDMLPLVFQLRNLANTVGATVAAINVPTVPLVTNEATFSTGVKSPPISDKQVDVPFSLSIVGTYNSIKAFIDGMFTMRRIVTVNNISLAINKEETIIARGASVSAKMLRLSLKVNTFYQPTDRPMQ